MTRTPDPVVAGDPGLPHPTVAVLGLGRAGRDLVHLLRGADVPVALAWRRGRGPGRIADVDTVSGALPARIPADVVLLAIPDGAIPSLGRRLAEGSHLSEDTAVLHISGALPAAALTEAGLTVPCGAMHPLQTLLGDGRPRRPFSWVLEGDEPALLRGRQLVRAMECEHVALEGVHRGRYHAAATMVSNHLVALARVAERQMGRAGIPADRLPALFMPLMAAAVENIGRVGTAEALTGPVVRGDVATVAAHLDVLADTPADLHWYRVASAALLPIARERGIDDASLQNLRALLDPPEGCRRPDDD